MSILNFILIIFAIITYSWSRYLVSITKFSSNDTPSLIKESMSSNLFLSSIVSIGLAISIVINSFFFLDISALKIIPAIILIVLSINRLVELIIASLTYNNLEEAKTEVEDIAFAVLGELGRKESAKLSNSEIEIYIKNFHPHYFDILKEMKMLNRRLYTNAIAVTFWLVLFFVVIQKL